MSQEPSASDARIRLEGAVELVESSRDVLRSLEGVLEDGWHRRIEWHRELIERLCATEQEHTSALAKISRTNEFTALGVETSAARARVERLARDALSSLGDPAPNASLGWLLQRLLERAPMEMGMSADRSGWLFGVAVFASTALLAWSRTAQTIAIALGLLVVGAMSWFLTPRTTWLLTASGLELIARGRTRIPFSAVTAIDADRDRVVVQVRATGGEDAQAVELETSSPPRVALRLAALAYSAAANGTRPCEATLDDDSDGFAFATDEGVLFVGPTLGAFDALRLTLTRDGVSRFTGAKAELRFWPNAACDLRPDGALRVDGHLLTLRAPPNDTRELLERLKR